MTDRGPKIADVASLVGDPARANMLAALMDRRALTASELACIAGVSPQTTRGHLAKLRDAELVAMERQGRHRYFRLASAQVAQLIEATMVVAAATTPVCRPRPWRGGDALRDARTCYDHLAGRLAVAVAESLDARGCVVLTPDGGDVTPSGRARLAEIGIAVPDAARRRAFCRPCLDWSERRPHIAGAVGAALLAHALERDWVRRRGDGRALDVTPRGRDGLTAAFGVRFDTTSGQPLPPDCV